MNKSSIARQIGDAFFLLLACSGIVWIASQNVKYFDVPSRVGFVSAAFCITGALAFCWARIGAYFIRKWDLPPRVSFRVGSVLTISGALFWFKGDRFGFLGQMLIFAGLSAGFICRRLAFPDLTDEQASAPEPPLSLFHN